MKRLNLTAKMAIVFSMLFFVIFTTGAFSLFYYFEGHYKGLIANQQFELISELARGLDRKINEAQKLISLAIGNPPPHVINNPKRLKSFFLEKVKGKPFLSHYFDHGIFLFSKNGDIIGEYPEETERDKYNFSDQDYIQETIKKEKPYISKPYLSSKPPYEPIIMFTHPLFNQDRELMAIIGGGLRLTKENFMGDIARVKIGNTGYVYLFDVERRIIIHPDRSRIMQQDVPVGANKLFDRAIEGFEGTEETITSRGLHSITSFKRLKNKHWILGANYPVEEAYSSIKRARWYLGFFVGIGVTLTIITIIILMKGFLNPLTTLTKQIKEIGEGTHDRKSVEVNAEGEIEALASSFNEMLKKLSDREEVVKTTLKSLQEREARIRAILDNSVEGIITINEEGVIEDFNPAAEYIFGYAAHEVLGQDVSILMPAPYSSEHKGYIKKYLTTGEKKVIGKRIEIIGRRKDGNKFPMEISISEVKIGERSIFTGLLRDITERKKTEEELKKLSRAIEHSSAVVIITDFDGIIEYVNPKFTQVTGYTREEAMGKRPNIVKSGETPLEEYKKLWDTIKSGEEWTGLFHNKKKNGDYYWVSTSISPVKDSKGNITHFVGIQEDITQIKKAEEELIKAKEIAETANKAKSIFLASMSHEIRTPMNAIIGMADLLMDTQLNSDQLRYVQVFKHAGENLLNIINDILDLSKIESGRLEIESIGFDIIELIEKTCDVMSIKGYEKGLEMACRIHRDVPQRIIGDPVRIRQVLINLIGNAIKFTERGEVVIEVSSVKQGSVVNGTDVQHEIEVDPLGSDRVILKFSVRDTGIGIPKEKINTIFDKFTQVDASTTRKYGGTGLGLTISKSLVRLMGGDLWVESEIGKGSTFSFTIPSAVQEGYFDRLSDKETEIENLRILIIDDNATNRMILTETISNWCQEVQEAESGHQGIKKLKDAKQKGISFSLILLDYHMPEMDGFEVAETIRKDPSISDIPIIMLTSDYARQHAARSKELNISSFITKPIKRSELLTAIFNVSGDILKIDGLYRPEEKKEAFEDLRKLKILISEDTEDNRLLIKSYLKNTPYELHFAENGDEAVRLYKEGRYNLILMDIQMPVMDGYEATRQIRKWEMESGIEKTPVVALTAFALKEEIQKSIDAGCDAHISKPIKKTALIEVIERYAR
ncbi:MAG: PAS domain S-box protein [Syntrophorhabdaceae bacterium]|nr:PAS domain S-box protein [Syntrophorhabdaceae bacterium]